MKVYLVSRGEYSDYRVCGIFSTPEKAEEAKVFFYAHDIDEWEIDALPPHPAGMVAWVVRMKRDGSTVFVNRVDCFDEESLPHLDSRGRECGFFMWARDETHAVKIANERRSMMITSGQWTEK